MPDKYEYECALSGLVAPGSAHFSDDGLDDLPDGWSEVRLSRRVFNPRWVMIQQVKKAMLGGLLAQFPDTPEGREMRNGQEFAIRLQVDAQFYGMEQDTPVYLTEVETVYLAPADLSEEVGAAYNEAREMLGLPVIEEPDEEEEVEDEEEESASVPEG